MIWRMATPFDTDYSFLNLPEMGSDVRGPIDLPSFEPVDFSFNIDQYAPERLPETELVQPSLDPFSVEENQELLSSARPFEDIQALGATFGQRLAETEKFFGDRINNLQGTIEQITGEKDQLNKDLDAAFLEQDNLKEQAIRDQIAALDEQRAELVAQLEQAVSEAEAQGVDAVKAAEQSAAEERQAFEGQISDLDRQLEELAISKEEAIAAGDQQRVQELEAQERELTAQREQIVAQMEEQFGGERGELEARIAEVEAAQEAALAERDQAIAEQDNIRAQAAEEQAAALEGLKQQLLEERAGIVGGLESEIGGLQSEIDNLTGARDAALAERDDAIAQQDTIRAEAAEQQAQALDAQAADYQAQLNQLTGQTSQFETQLGERDQTIADLQAQLAALQEGQQPPAETPTGTPQIPDASSIPGFQEQFPYLDLLSQEQPQEVKDMVAKSLATGEPVISQDQIQDMINKMGGQAGPVKAPQVPPKKSDQLFIDDRPKFISEERMPRPPRNFGGVNLGGTPSTGSKLDDFVPPPGYKEGPIEGGPAVRPGGPIQIRPINVGGPVVRPGPKPVLKPTKDLIAGGFVKSPIKTPPPRMSVGGIGGFAGGRSGRMIRR